MLEELEIVDGNRRGQCPLDISDGQGYGEGYVEGGVWVVDGYRRGQIRCGGLKPSLCRTLAC